MVARSTGLFCDVGAFITEVSNYSDPVSETFQMRCFFDDRQMTVSLEEFRERFQIAADDFGMDYHLRPSDELPRLLQAVSKSDQR